MSRQLLMAVRDGEAEPVVIDTLDPSRVILELDDGMLLEFDARELRSAVALPIRTMPRRPLRIVA
jgi:hypothetical protein